MEISFDEVYISFCTNINKFMHSLYCGRAMKAATMILDFTSKDNGASLTIEDEISAGTLLKTSDI